RGSAPTILAVDDNEEDLDLIEAVLAQDGCRIVRASTGKQALEIIRRGGPFVLLVDLILPDISGLKVLKEAQWRHPSTTSVILTASTRRQDAINAMLDGAFDFLVKPVDSDHLRAVVRRAIQHCRLQEELREKKEEAPIEACREFLADCIHELKSPLSIIQGYASFLSKEGAAKPQLMTSGLRAINRSAHQLRGLVDDFLDTERLRSQKASLNLEPVPVAEILSQTVESYRILAGDRRIELCWGVIGDGGIRVRADVKRLRQILGNLITNAIKFTTDGGRIGLWAREKGKEVVFCIEDSGVGMRREDCAKVFGRKTQIDTPLPNGRGLGLGLTIAKELLALHGGRIWVQSEPGKGSRFYFTLAMTEGSPDPSKFTALPNTDVRYVQQPAASPAL
ncbi:MAG: HAMP domain-containing sensor histidine kinase, partial [Elusimicrobiota bacterium]